MSNRLAYDKATLQRNQRHQEPVFGPAATQRCSLNAYAGVNNNKEYDAKIALLQRAGPVNVTSDPKELKDYIKAKYSYAAMIRVIGGQIQLIHNGQARSLHTDF